MAPFWISLQLRLMEVVVTTGDIRCAKLQSNRHHQQTNTQLFTDRITFHGLAHPNLTWGLPTSSLTAKGSWLPWGGLSRLSTAHHGTLHAVTQLLCTGKNVRTTPSFYQLSSEDC